MDCDNGIKDTNEIYETLNDHYTRRQGNECWGSWERNGSVARGDVRVINGGLFYAQELDVAKYFEKRYFSSLVRWAPVRP
jgi:hypothetical protein